MTRQRQILVTVTYNDLGCIIDTKAEPYEEPNLQPTCNQLATDCISRQSAIDAVSEGCQEWRGIFERCEEKLLSLPSAVPEPVAMPIINVAEGFDSIEDEDGNMGFGIYDPTEKHIWVAGDLPHEMFVKALFHELMHWIQDVVGRQFDEDEANCFSDMVYDVLLSAQPEQQWTPSGKKPPREGSYLVWMPFAPPKHRMAVAEYCGGYWNIKTPISAWMPLPEPYEGNRNG